MRIDPKEEWEEHIRAQRGITLRERIDPKEEWEDFVRAHENLSNSTPSIIMLRNKQAVLWARDEIDRLKAENAKLTAKLAAHSQN